MSAREPENAIDGPTDGPVCLPWLYVNDTYRPTVVTLNSVGSMSPCLTDGCAIWGQAVA